MSQGVIQHKHPNGLKQQIALKFRTLSFQPTENLLNELGMSLHRFEGLYKQCRKMTFEEAVSISEVMGFPIMRLVKEKQPEPIVNKKHNHRLKLDQDFANKFSRKVMGL